MTNRLHITNGDSAANIINASHIPGEVLPWRDPMHHGPFLADLPLERQSRIRIDYLTGKFQSLEVSLLDETINDFSERDAKLNRYKEYDEVVLWFEHDLLDQLQIIQLLDWFANQGNYGERLSIICINQFQGVQKFRGIGQLTPGQMAVLYSYKRSVSHHQFKIAQQAWAAFCASGPQALSAFINVHSEDISPNSANQELPFLLPALLRHCQEYPWTSDGLTRTERQLLTLVSSGVQNPQRVFLDNMNFEDYLYIGDWRTYSQIETLCQSSQPLLECSNGELFQHPVNIEIRPEEAKAQELVLTELGRKVLAKKANVFHVMQRDSWLGGVHWQTGKNEWFWDDANAVFCSQP